MVATQSGDRSILPSELCQGTKNLQGGGATRTCYPLVARFDRFDVEMELAILVRPHGATMGVKVEPEPISAGNARVRCHVCRSGGWGALKLSDCVVDRVGDVDEWLDFFIEFRIFVLRQ